MYFLVLFQNWKYYMFLLLIIFRVLFYFLEHGEKYQFLICDKFKFWIFTVLVVMAVVSSGSQGLFPCVL